MSEYTEEILYKIESITEYKNMGLLTVISTINSYINAKLVEEIQPEQKLVKHPKYTELANPKLETKK